jgi:ElaB/YqjD/DUF883 family membrane-anchored ribosome-binding protein
MAVANLISDAINRGTIKMATNMSVNKAASGAHGVIDRAASAATSAADEAARMVKPAIDRTTQVAHQAVDKAAGVAVPTVEWLSARADSLQIAGGKVAEGGRTAIRDRPWQALGAALAIGVLLGRILR